LEATVGAHHPRPDHAAPKKAPRRGHSTFSQKGTEPKPE
jgi:hypothetical protein